MSCDTAILVREVCREPLKGLLFVNVGEIASEGETTITIGYRAHAGAEYQHVVTIALGAFSLRELIKDLQRELERIDV